MNIVVEGSNRADRDNILPHENLALLVVGKMGQGKSSFCKMIASKEQKPSIKVGGSVENCTYDCNVYRSDFFQDILQKDIFLVDTPGLDSKELFLIIEMIDQVVSERKLSIVGIAYVISLNANRQKPEEGLSIVQNFLYSLKIRYADKINLSMCLLTNYDRNYDLEDTLQEKMQSYENIFHKIHFRQLWERRILWINEPLKDKKVFERKIEGDCKESFANQFIKLKEYLQSNVWLRLRSQTYLKCNKAFEEHFVQDLLLKYHLQEYSKENYVVQYEMCFKKKSITESIGDFGLGFNRMGGYGLGAILLGLATKSLLIPLTLGCTALLGLHHSTDPSIRKFELKQEEDMKAMLEKRIHNTLSVIVYNLVKFEGTKVTIPKQEYIVSVRCKKIEGEEIEIQADDYHQLGYYRLKLNNGKYRLFVECKSISHHSYKKFLLEETKRYFSRKQS